MLLTSFCKFEATKYYELSDLVFLLKFQISNLHLLFFILEIRIYKDEFSEN
jgi:hypothetical protein